jgi:23S rRNA (cytidine1920-2'-O)/16S rRNA (cytidine1409-2'-O)-methyltransferase
MQASSVGRVFQPNTRPLCVLAILAFRRPRTGNAAERRMAMKKRLDVLLVERGLAENRSQAQALVLAGRVPGHSKAGEQVDEEAELQVEPGPRFVSRGGEKLMRALEELEVDVTEEGCLDVGASTGGFTDCLLQAGAARVIALDVGYGQLHPRLRSDPRVTVVERTNVKDVDCSQLPFQPTFVTADVSFISLRKALPPALDCAAKGWRALVLVKPQFEAGRADVGKGGVVRDSEVLRRVLDEVSAEVPEWGGRLEATVESGLPGPKGNREFFLYITAAG